MKKTEFLMVLLCLLWMSAFARIPLSFADMYQYTDSRGVVNMTNELKSVPQKYRANMTVIREAPKKKEPAKQTQEQEQEASQTADPAADAAAPAQAPQGRFAELSARFVWFKPLVYLVAIVAALLAVIKVTSQLSSPHLSKVIYLAFFMGVFVFLYKAYVSHMVDSTLKIKEKAVIMMKKSSVREAPATTGEEGAPARQ